MLISKDLNELNNQFDVCLRLHVFYLPSVMLFPNTVTLVCFVLGSRDLVTLVCNGVLLSAVESKLNAGCAVLWPLPSSHFMV